MPVQCKYSSNNTKIIFDFNKNGNIWVNGLWNMKKINKSGVFMNNVTIENALVVRNLNFTNNEKYIFDLIQIDKLPKLKAFRMYFKVIDNEMINVKAGVFKTKKVLFTLTDWRNVFYKAYYYISDDEHRYIVKIINIPVGGETELLSIE